MAFYLDEEEVWKCPKHPSRRRRTGICPNCLRDRLLALCPDCAHARPCACFAAAATTSSSSSSSSSSFSLLSGTGVGAVGRLSCLIDSEPAFRRSRSTAIPLLRSRFGADEDSAESDAPPVARRAGKPSFWSSVFKSQKTKRDGREVAGGRRNEVIEREESLRWRMLRSRSVGVSSIPNSGGTGGRSKCRGWSFPSPINVFRQSKATKVVQERSPLHRG